MRLGDLCRIQSGGTPARQQTANFSGAIPWVKIGDMLQGKIRSTEECLSEAGIRGSSAKILPAGTVLISIFATIGRTAVLEIDAATNQAIAGLTPNDPEKLNPLFLRRFLDSTVSDLEKRARGVAQVNINLSILKSIEIPLPNICEQERILGILDQVDALREKRRKSIALLDDLAQSIFLDMFEGQGSADKTIPLGSLAEVASGITKGRRVATNVPLRNVPYLAVANVQDKRLNLDAIKRIDATESEIERYRLMPDDLLLTEGGDPDKLGRGTLWRSELRECIHQNHIFRVRLRDNLTVRPTYLNWVISSERGRRYFLRSAKQTTGIASINATQLRSFPVPIAPIAQQRLFEDRIRAIDRCKRHHDAAGLHLDTLFSSIQSRAFRGELWQDDLKDL
ncbi:restriction endonuclease subunit S [Nocardia cyriacigeorgica]|uniref:restriction endonuclease subunit S n=1 Tax=Nocardia cyriacigeorgica TaxID=135487 RepID=UPI001E4FD4DE|nr:restriction endonuclease subunit S [Nocardia cyriacigeorgica]